MKKLLTRTLVTLIFFTLIFIITSCSPKAQPCDAYNSVELRD